MLTGQRVRGDDRRLEVLAVVAANCLPLVGVLALGWSAAALVAVYWFELAALCFWALVRALFAGRPSEFDGDPLLLGALADRPVGIPIPRTGLRIHLSSLPVLVVAAPMLALAWFVAGVLTVGLVGDAGLEGEALSTVTLAALAMFGVEGGRTAYRYFYRGGCREHSAQTAIQGVFWRCGVLFVVGLFTVFIVIAADPSTAADDSIGDADPSVASAAALAVVVLVKIAFDLAGTYRDRLTAFDESLGVELGWAYEPPTSEPVEASLSESARRVRPPLAGRLLAGLSHSRRYPAAWVVGAFPIAIGLLFASAGAWTAAAGLVAVGVLAALLLTHVDYWLRYAGVEYRTDGEAVVASDRLCQTPLWRVEAWDESEVRLERDRIDRWLETTTVVIELPDRELRVPRLPDPDPVLEVFDRAPREDVLELERSARAERGS